MTTQPLEPEDPTIAYEQAAEQAVTQGFADQVMSVVTTLLQQWFALDVLWREQGPGSQDMIRLRDQAVRMLMDIQPSMATSLDQAVKQGIAIGVEISLEELGGQAEDSPGYSPVADKTLDTVVEQVDDRARRRLHAAADAARTMEPSLDSVASVLGKAQTAVSAARSDVRWATNRAVNVGAAGVAKAMGWRLLWVAERNACLQCLAYSGLAVEPGQLFPGGLTFDSKPSKAPPTPYPPRHPNCRCRVQPYDGPDAAAEGFSASDPATALKREARRSVLRGFSGYASEGARLRAADELLKRGAALPKTVVERARRDVRRGKFNQRRTKG